MPFCLRPRFVWRLRRRTLELGERTLLMGILNVTPDSFSDGGLWMDGQSAVRHGVGMLDAGADVLDIGGESTRPDAEAISPELEAARVIPVVAGVLAARPEAIVSIDTYHASTARLAVEAGAEIVNDVSGLLWDERMGAACAEMQCGIVLMHTRGRPKEWRGLPPLAAEEVVPLVSRGLAARAEAAMRAGIARDALMLDPGFGFGKAFVENLPLLAGLGEMHGLGFPVLAGVSRKGFLRRIAAEAGVATPDGLTQATSAAHVAAVLGGAHMLRVHDVAEARVAVAVADRVLEAAAVFGGDPGQG